MLFLGGKKSILWIRIWFCIKILEASMRLVGSGLVVLVTGIAEGTHWETTSDQVYCTALSVLLLRFFGAFAVPVLSALVRRLS